MKGKWVDVFWGFILILLGGLFLAQNLGYISDLAASIWSIIFAGASVLFFFSYFSKGKEQWGWLFPALITASLAIIIWLGAAGRDGAYMGTMILWSCALPFFVAYSLDRKQNWWGLIPGWSLGVIGLVVLLSDAVRGEWIGALIMFGIALPFFVVYLANRQQWWALIPAYVLSALGIIILASNTVRGEYVGAFFMFAIALPFYVLYFRNKKLQWALIPAYVLTVLGLVAGFSGGIRGEYVGALFMFALSALFVIIYWRHKENWWAQIPAGILGSVGLVVLLGSSSRLAPRQENLLGVLLFLGIAATFGVLWLQRNRYPVEWAKYPAVGFAAGSLIVLVFGGRPEIITAIALILIGVWLLFENRRQPKLKG